MNNSVTFGVGWPEIGILMWAIVDSRENWGIGDFFLQKLFKQRIFLLVALLIILDSGERGIKNYMDKERTTNKKLINYKIASILKTKKKKLEIKTETATRIISNVMGTRDET